jgi:D-3-phosphoglycerate dehydrogenase
MLRVIISDHISGDLGPERSLLEPLGVELVVAAATDEATLVELAGQADALLVCYASIPRSVVEAAASAGCRVIARTGIGYDNVDIRAASEHGIVVTNVPDYCLEEVADQTLLLLLAAARNLLSSAESVREGGWRFDRAIRRLESRRLALLGFGRIGREVARRALAFRLDVTVYDPLVPSVETPLQRADTLADAVGEADFVSLHTPLTSETRHLIRDETIALMRRAPVLLNTARGGLVDLDAVLRGLDDGHLGGVALDVTEPEPLPTEHPLRTHERAIVTPHMAYYSVEAERDLQLRAADEVARALRGEPPRCPVNPEVLKRT